MIPQILHGPHHIDGIILLTDRAAVGAGLGGCLKSLWTIERADRLVAEGDLWGNDLW